LSDKIFIKNMTETPGLENCLRVTVGTREECDLFIQSLKNSLI
jgi:histidinol-phosphate/aromatic aminotransferase/cobyric acid decarboxylase-like protein